MSTAFRGSVLLRSRMSGWVAAISGIVMVLSAALFVAGVQAAAFGMYALYGLLIAGALHLSWTRHSEREAAIEVDDRGVWVDRALLRARRKLASATILPRKDKGPMVELRRAWDPYPARVALQDAESARAFVRALGLDAREGLTRFRAPFAGNDAFGFFVTAMILLTSVACVILPGLALMIVPLMAAVLMVSTKRGNLDA